MVIDDIQSIIATDGLAVLSTNLFKGEIPPTAPDLCVAVGEYPGSAEEGVFSGSPVERPRVQVQVRGVALDYATPRLLAERISRAFANRGGFTVNSTRYLDVSPVQPVFPLYKDDNDRWVFAVNLSVKKEQSPLV
jgi:hypothetical protein